MQRFERARFAQVFGPALFATITTVLTVGVAINGGSPLLLTILALVAASQIALTVGLLRCTSVRGFWARWNFLAQRLILTALVGWFASGAVTRGGISDPLAVVLVVVTFYYGSSTLLLLVLQLRGKLPTAKERSMTQWWYNYKTKQVEEGQQSLGSDRDGPFASREEAARAPEIIAERAKRWAAEDAAGD